MGFQEDMLAIFENRQIDALEDKIREKLAAAQYECETADGMELHRAQGDARAWRAMLELPGELLVDINQTTE